MEPQGCYENKKIRKKRNCLGIVAVILLSAFIFVIGLIVAAETGIIAFLTIPVIVSLAIILGLFLMLNIILIICKKEKKC